MNNQNRSVNKSKLLSFLIILVQTTILNAQIGGQINLLNKDIQKIEVENNYVQLSFFNSLQTEDIGHPQIPYITYSYVLPKDAKVTGIDVSNVKREQLDGLFNIYPTQPPIPNDLSYSNNIFKKNNSIYSTNRAYPEHKVKILFDGFEQGYHIITIGIYPIEYIPNQQKVYLNTFNFNIEYSSFLPQKNNNNATFANSPNSESKNYINSIIKNPEDLLSFSPTISKVNQSKNISSLNNKLLKMQEIVPRYIIVTNEELKHTFQVLANWKTKKGIPVLIKTIESIYDEYKGGDRPEKIRNYLIECSQKWGPNIFVLLGGDYNIIPSKKYKSVQYNMNLVVDLYYSTTDIISSNAPPYHNGWESNMPSGNLWYEVNTILGRAPVENIEEAKTFVNKVIIYEKAQVKNNSYYNNLLVTSPFMNINTNKTEVSDIAKYAFKTLVRYPENLNKYFMFDDASCSGLSKYKYTPYNESSMGGGDCVAGDEELSSKNVFSALSKGRKWGYFHFIFHDDHSSETNLGISSRDKGESLNREDVDKLNNSSYFQILSSTSCLPANFEKDCVAERYLNNPNGGGVAFIGNSDAGYRAERYQLKTLMNSLSSSDRKLGYHFRKIQTLNGNGSYVGSNRKIVLLGDPTMEVWTNTPQELKVTTIATPIKVGKTKVSVKIENIKSDEKAIICLMKGNDAYLAEEITGDSTYNYTIDSYTSDSIDVTVTAHNYIPYEKRIEDPAKYNTNLSISKLTFDDSMYGNGDEKLDAGETIELTVTLKNTGTSTVNDVSAILECGSEYITIENDSVKFGSIGSNATKASTAKYKFTINKDAPQISLNDLNALTFQLKIKDEISQEYFDKFNIEVSVPKIELRDQIVTSTTNGNKIIEAGETVKLKINLFNSGKAEAVGLKAKLVSDNPYVSTISSKESIYPGIKFQETKLSDNEFIFTVSNSYIDGSPLNFKLEVENAYGRKEEDLSFDILDKPSKFLIIRNIGTNADTVKFTNAVSSITLQWKYNEKDNVYNIYRCDTGADGIYKKINTFPLSYSYFADYELAPLKKYYYKIAMVSKSGNEGEMSDAFETWTTLPYKGLFPVSMNLSMASASMAPILTYDVDGDGKKEIFSGMSGKDQSKQGYLLGFNHQGEELFDLDNNVTTYSGFANMNAVTRASVAIGDLFGNGENQIVSVTRENGSNPNYITAHTLNDINPKDNKPDILWQNEIPNNEYYLQGAVLSNIDNSPDGSMEIILHPDNNNKALIVLKNTGEELWSVNINPEWNVSAPAVADLNNDGYKEIILGCVDGVYIWDHTGKPMINKASLNHDVWVYKRPGYSFHHSPIVCDLRNNGTKQIIIRATKDNTKENYVHVIDFNTCELVNGWGTSNQLLLNDGSDKASTSNPLPFSVGDLKGDGELKVVALGRNALKVWDCNGTLLLNKSIETSVDSQYPTTLTPILADLDGDSEIEILVASNRYGNDLISAFKLDGSSVPGFPLKTSSNFNMDPTVADIDGDGKNEILAVTNGTVYAWETNGSPNRIEWGSSRGNAQNTGEYTCYSNIIISQNTQWNDIKRTCGDIVIQSGYSLILEKSASLTLGNTSSIVIQTGASLIINGGKIYSANIKALSGSNVKFTNNAYVKLRPKGLLDIQKGAIFDYRHGTIDIE